jgi:hypothetical protein
MARRVRTNKTAGAAREARAAPAGVARLPNVGQVTGSGLLDARSGTSAVLALQRLAGNKAVSETILAGRLVVGHGGTCGDTPEMKCSASAAHSHTKSLTFSPPVPAKAQEGVPQFKSSGTVKADFTTSVDIQLATVPPGYSDCATAKLQKLIDKKLLPHEKEHKKRFLTKNKKHSWVGIYKKTLKETGPDPDALHGTLEANLEALLDEEVTKRKDRNEAYAVTAIDPFNVTTDISDCPECDPEADS